jgi:arylsulfatase A-like enzyme
MLRTHQLFAATLSLLLLVGCGPDGEAPAPGVRGKPNIVLVTVDTLRADHLACYGYFRETSPHLDALSREGVLFERAYSVMGTTLPSHLSIMTGLYPHQHGYVANHGAMAGGFRSSAGRTTLAEALSGAGYATAAFVSGPTVSRATGLDSGFELFDEHKAVNPKTLEDTSRRSAATTDAAIAWLESNPPQPFFLWVHYWDPHEPNIPEEPFASTFQSDEQLEALIDERRIDPARLQALFPVDELARLFAPELAPRIFAGEEVQPPVIDREAIRRLINLYDGDVLATDSSLGRLLDSLKATGLYDQALIAVTADHGQALGQHDWLEHGRIQGEDLHVPLVLRFPAGVLEGPRRVSDVVSSVDLVPTLLAKLPDVGAGDLARQVAGEDALDPKYLRNFAFSQRSVRDRDWEPEGGDDGLKFSLTTREWKYYFRPQSQDELYDLRQDPGELRDVASEHPDIVERLRERVELLLEDRPYTPEAGGEGESDAARAYREQLEKIGYIGK